MPDTRSDPYQVETALGNKNEFVNTVFCSITSSARYSSDSAFGARNRVFQWRTTQQKVVLYRGRIANAGGDRVLAEFGSAVDAVECAVEAQAALAGANADLPPDLHISLVTDIGNHCFDRRTLLARLYPGRLYRLIRPSPQVAYFFAL
jgi:hypothetical protein